MQKALMKFHFVHVYNGLTAVVVTRLCHRLDVLYSSRLDKRLSTNPGPLEVFMCTSGGRKDVVERRYLLALRVAFHPPTSFHKQLVPAGVDLVMCLAICWRSTVRSS